jgi:ferredoxin
MGYTVQVDRDACISTGNCVRSAPEAFAFDAEDISVPQPDASDLPVEKLVRVARGCPVGAIHLFDEGGQELDPYSS